jgi:acyl-CoA thioesterase FadM
VSAGKPPASAATASSEPFVYRFRPRWAHCDPARMIYTPRFGDFCMEAIEAWFEARVGADWYRINLDWGIGTPFVHMEIDFRSPVTARDTLLIRVAVDRVGTSSIGFQVAASAEAEGRLCFEGRSVCVSVPAANQGRDHERGEALGSMPLDERLRSAAEADLALHQTRR